MKSKRITESELVLPALYIMNNSSGGCISTAELIPILTRMFNPVGIDAEILENRNDSYFSQKVRNLKSHNTFSKMGFARYENDIKKFQITDLGRKIVEENKENLDYLFSNGFSYEDIKDTLVKISSRDNKSALMVYEEIVSEGDKRAISSNKYTRSNKLRTAAIEYYSSGGVIKCHCCNFEFRSFYGDRYGESCIEIHHLKPIFQYGDEGVTETVSEAIKNLLPVCPNCHRVIHKNHITAEMIQTFRNTIIAMNSL